ncbi:unnamed protein product [Schistosoma spindalis]|nr:unnamed protein product [Schistosoma spindale]CAI2732198.1 unnamed protein product [Schistosoma spindale]
METRSKKPKENDEMDGKISKAVCGMSEFIDDKRDDISVNSMSSAQFSTSRLRLDKALLKKKILEKRLELERQLKMLELQEEVDMAELECKVIENDNRLPVDRSETNAKVERYLDCDTAYNKHSGEVFNNTKCDWINELKDTLRTTVNSTVLPKIDMMFFDGQPSQYHRFISQFTSIIESKLSDKCQLLSYLSYYCKGKARTAIEACISLPSHLGYDRAKQILYDLFGKEHLVARNLITELLNHKSVEGSADGLTDFAIKLRNVCITLKEMGYMSDVNSTANLEIIVSRLPLELQNKWVEAADRIMMAGREPIFEELVMFVEERARIARSRFGRLVHCNSKFRKGNYEGHVDRRSRLNVVKREPSTSLKTLSCEICFGHHKEKDCMKLSKMNVTERRLEVRRRGLCYLCLRKGHIAKSCNSDIRCDVDNCRIRHNPLLHIDANNKHMVNFAKDFNSSKVCLGIIPVRLYGPKGCLETYALLDSGSDTSIVCEELINRLGIEGKETSIRVTTVNGTSTCECLEVNLEVFSLDQRGSIKINKAYTTKKLPIDYAEPLTELQLRRWKHLRDITLPRLQSNLVGILIGCDAPDAHWVLEQRLGDRKHPFGVRTHLGWMILGPKGVSRSLHQVQWCHCSTNDILRDIERLYNHEFEDADVFRNEYSVEDKRALEIVNNSFRLEGGHFQVGLLWKYDKPRLPNNLELAERRLECLRKRFMKDNSLLEKYQAVMNKHLSKGYIIEASKEGFDRDAVCWYIPHHPVINPKKPGKLRIVFDCAAVYQGCSLNDQLLRGPNTVNSLIGILLRFRLGNVALAADIEEMFLQVKIPRQDRGAFRLLWWEDGDIRQRAKEYCLTVHPFGAVSSPFCANFALRKSVDIFGKELNKNVREVVDKSFYVDDYLASIDNVQDAIELAKALGLLLRKGGFRLTKWISNCLQVLESIDPDERAEAVREIDFERLPTERTLGLFWNTIVDAFEFKVRVPKRPLTRRGILSSVASLYDPLGLLAPFILPMKQLLQRLSKLGLGWDEEIPSEECKRWLEILSELQRVENVSFPRCVLFPQSDRSLLELHIFCDASEIGYGAVAYIRSCILDTGIYSRLITAKARVTPLKVQTIPRLELTAAVLAARMGSQLQSELDIKFAEVKFWTDSMIVLHYIRNEKSQFKTFIANRISTIHSLTKVDQWRFVPSKENVADFASRGVGFNIDHVKVWEEGPHFLRKPKECWPDANVQDPEPHLLELKKAMSMHVMVGESTVDLLINYYSDWTRLLKAVAWMIRFKQYLLIMYSGRGDLSLQVGMLRVDELNLACLDLIRYVQSIVFRKEIEMLSSDNISKVKITNSPLRILNPMIIDGLLCVGGRLQISSWSESRKHPIILPSKHTITNLILRYYHVLEGHVGATQVMATVRERFWVLRGGVAMRRVIKDCVYCKRRNARPIQQLMAPLPPVRIEGGDYPFLSVGVDYFGPLMVKHGRNTEKRYGCVFTRLKLRAVHLEVAYSFTTDSFIMALMRFVSRRGYSKEIFSDNGSNLVGAEHELRKCLQGWVQERIHSDLLKKGIDWHFNPPAASHWGGVWERMIRSVRRVLSTLVKEQPLTDECLETFMTEAERIINNRPLVPVTDDPKDLDAITPAKLLLLRENVAEFANTLSNDRYSKRWKQANYLAQVFWRRWSKEYVSLLQRRYKWTQLERNIREGDLVMICSDFSEKNKWPLGLVQRVIPRID